MSRYGNKNFDERRIWEVGVKFPVYEYNIVKEVSGDSSMSSTIATCMMTRLENPNTPSIPWRPPINPEETGRHMIIVRLTKPEYDKFIDYCDRTHDSMTNCVRRLIFWEV